MVEQATNGRVAHVLRMIVCVFTFGFVFPHSFMETADAAKLAAAEVKVVDKK
jgi:hypothetical protein